MCVLRVPAPIPDFLFAHMASNHPYSCRETVQAAPTARLTRPPGCNLPGPGTGGGAGQPRHRSHAERRHSCPPFTLLHCPPHQTPAHAPAHPPHLPQRMHGCCMLPNTPHHIHGSYHTPSLPATPHPMPRAHDTHPMPRCVISARAAAPPRPPASPPRRPPGPRCPCATPHWPKR